MTDVEWKKMYNQLDKRNRDLKEELDIISARNKNGRYCYNIQNLRKMHRNYNVEKQVNTG